MWFYKGNMRFIFLQVADAMRRMHERQNIGKVILLPDPKKKEEEEEEGEPQSNAEAGERVEKTESAASETKEGATEEAEAAKD